MLYLIRATAAILVVGSFGVSGAHSTLIIVALAGELGLRASHGIEIFPYLSSCGFESIVAGFLRKSP